MADTVPIDQHIVVPFARLLDGSTSMNVDGSIVPVTFIFQTVQQFTLIKLNIIVVGRPVQNTGFGSLPTLPNGITFELVLPGIGTVDLTAPSFRDDADEPIIVPIRQNGDWHTRGGAVTYNFSDGVYVDIDFVPRCFIPASSAITVTINDDLSGLDDMQVWLEGFHTRTISEELTPLL